MACIDLHPLLRWPDIDPQGNSYTYQARRQSILTCTDQQGIFHTRYTPSVWWNTASSRPCIGRRGRHMVRMCLQRVMCHYTLI